MNNKGNIVDIFIKMFSNLKKLQKENLTFLQTWGLSTI